MFILQGYDGIAVVSTLRPKEGLVVVKFSSTVKHDVYRLLSNLACHLTSQSGTIA